MKYRLFGKTGWKVSEIGFGAWAIGGGWGPTDDEESMRAMHKALELGVNFIDTAAGYGNGRSERLIGKLLKERKAGEKVFVATKTHPQDAPGGGGDWPPGPFEKWEDRYPESYLRKSVEERLRNLQTDCLDLLQLHTWTRTWNRDPQPLLILQNLRNEGKLRFIGISTPEHDQNSVNDLMKAGLLDSVQVIYNIFDQEPAAELLPVALENKVGIIVRVVFDEGVLTGKFTKETKFAEGDFRRKYFQGDRLERAAARAGKVKDAIAGSGYTMAQAALKFALAHPAVATVISGIRNVKQAEMNCTVSELPEMSAELQKKLHGHNWRRAMWYLGK